MSAAYLLLEDGTRFDGESVGAPDVGTGEVVFNTAMSGYQEAVTDPSYAGQIIVFTYPLIGNYGVARAHMESDRIHARAVIMREGSIARTPPTPRAAGSPGSPTAASRRCPASTRARSCATSATRARCAAGCSPPTCPRRRRASGSMAEPSMTGADLAREVTPAEPLILEGDGPARDRASTPASRTRSCATCASAACSSSCIRAHVTAEELLAREPDAVFLANGPGDPAALDYIVDAVRGVVGKTPVWGICLGHQLLCRAVGLETYKLPVRPPRREPPGEGPRDGPDRDHLAEPRLRGARPRRPAHDRHRRAGPLGHGLRRRRAAAAEPLRPDGRGPGAARRARARPCSTTPRPGPVRTTPCTCSTASWSA